VKRNVTVPVGKLAIGPPTVSHVQYTRPPEGLLTPYARARSRDTGPLFAYSTLQRRSVWDSIPPSRPAHGVPWTRIHPGEPNGANTHIARRGRQRLHESARHDIWIGRECLRRLRAPLVGSTPNPHRTAHRTTATRSDDGIHIGTYALVALEAQIAGSGRIEDPVVTRGYVRRTHA
jgi:hypothetical protein